METPGMRVLMLKIGWVEIYELEKFMDFFVELMRVVSFI